MALVVEDGTGLVAANAYTSEADADTYMDDYHSAADVVLWDAGDKVIAIQDATLYMVQKYGVRWKGYRTNETQALDWPRSDVQDYDGYILNSDEMPAKLKQACSELAYLSVTETAGLWANQATPGTITRKKVKAGPVEQDITYSGASQTKRFPRVASLLAPYLHHTGVMVRG
jgi:hypothetical protein